MSFNSLVSGAADSTCFGHWSLIFPDPHTTAGPRIRRAPGPGLWLPRPSSDGLSPPLGAQEDSASGRGGFTLCARREILLAISVELASRMFWSQWGFCPRQLLLPPCTGTFFRVTL